MEDLKSEVLLIDKPAGITSFDVIRILRKKLRIKKMGHAGTLDPLATGLMIIGIGNGTKKLHTYLRLPKTYEAEILLGERRTTGDMEGRVTEMKPVLHVDDDRLCEVLRSLEGKVLLPVSPYSAIKQGGVPLYKRARKAEQKNEEITTLPIREMEVRSAAFLESEWLGESCIVRATFDVGSGTYIRSLAEEYGKRLGYPATLRMLRRTRIGEFSISDAVTLEL